MVNNRRGFGPLLPGVDHLRHTHDPAGAAFSRGQRAEGADLADELERLVALHGAETIAAVIVEPVAGSTGVLPPPVGYLERLRQIATRHGILLIFDEVITAFGRLGAPCAAAHFGVVPDMITCAKGLTNAAVPMGAVAAGDHVYRAIVEGAAPGIELFHGYTYSGHPWPAPPAWRRWMSMPRRACSSAASLAGYFEEAVHALRGTRHVIDVRNLGLVAGIELEPRADAPGARATEIFHRCFDEGLLIRVTGDTLALSPPLILTTAHIDEMVGKIGEVWGDGVGSSGARARWVQRK